MAGTDLTNDLEDKKEFFLRATRVLELKGLVNQDILYIFCGNGRRFMQILLHLYPKIRKVYFTNLLDSFNVENIPRKTELFAANIQDVSKLSEHKGYFSHIISLDCFNWLKDAKNGFGVIYHLLKVGGTAAILFYFSSPFQDCFKDLIENSEWKYSYLGQESMFPKFPAQLNRDEYKALIEDIGFTVVECEEYNRIFEFESLMDFYDKCMSFISPLLAYIPKEEHQKFENDYLDNFKKFHGLSYRGRQRIKGKTLSLFIRKPVPLPPFPFEDSASSLPTSTSAASSSSTLTSSTVYTFSYVGGRFLVMQQGFSN